MQLSEEQLLAIGLAKSTSQHLNEVDQMTGSKVTPTGQSNRIRPDRFIGNLIRREKPPVYDSVNDPQLIKAREEIERKAQAIPTPPDISPEFHAKAVQPQAPALDDKKIDVLISNSEKTNQTLEILSSNISQLVNVLSGNIPKPQPTESQDR